MELIKEEIKNLIQSHINTIVMYRLTFDGKRAYCTDDPFVVYSGLTGALTAATFKGSVDAKRLDKWRDGMVKSLGSIEAQEAYLNSMADFGSLCHQVLVRIKEQGKLVWKEEVDIASDFFRQSAIENGIIPNSGVIRKQVWEYQKSAASLLQFVHENVVEILAIESMCKCDDLMIATPVDMVCRIKEKKGESVVSLNIKTSAQFSDHQREQVAVEKYLWNKTYPNNQVAKTGLVRPKAWSEKKGIPTFDFELLDEQTEYSMITDTLSRLNQCKNNQKSSYLIFPREVMMFLGETKLGETPKISSRNMEDIFKEEQAA